jgi:hypothetical protein
VHHTFISEAAKVNKEIYKEVLALVYESNVPNVNGKDYHFKDATEVSSSEDCAKGGHTW